MSIALDSYSNEDVIVAGQMRINITDYAVLLKMNKYGRLYWSKMSYPKTIINFVKIYNDSIIYAINNQQVASATGVIHLLQLTPSGNIQRAIRYGASSFDFLVRGFTIIDTETFYLNFYYEIISYDLMKLLIRSVSLVTTFSNITSAFCLSTLDTNFRVHRSVSENGTVYSLGMMFDQILQMRINLTQFGKDGFLNNSFIVSSDQKNVKKDYDTMDMVLVTNSTRGWSASATLDQKIIVHQFHKSDFLPRIAFKVVLNETIDAIRLVALDQDSLFIAVVSDKTTSLVIYIKLDLGITQSIKFQKVFRSLVNYAIPILTGENSHLILASSKIGASNASLAGFQMILFKTRVNDFTSDYNCYSFEQAVISNIENLNLTWITYNILANNVSLVTSDVIATIETNTTWLTSTSQFTVRAESSKTNDAGDTN